MTLTIKSSYLNILDRRYTALIDCISYKWKPDFIDEEKKQIFKASHLLKNKTEYKVNYGSWKTKTDDIPNIFYIFDESLPKGEYYIDFEKIIVIYKDKYKINFKLQQAIKLTKYNLDFLDLYSA